VIPRSANGRQRRISGRAEAGARCGRGFAYAGFSEGDTLQGKIGERVLGLVGERRGHGDFDPAHAFAHLGADLHQLEPDGAAGRGGELGVTQTDPPERLEQDVSEGRELQPELVGAQGPGRRAIGEQIELLLVDPILDLARAQ